MLRIGTDCSGIEAPIQALKRLGIPFRHVFSCEQDEHCIASIRENYHPERLDTDMMTRDIYTLPSIDLYVCGFPCQPFSSAGKRQGMEDELGRGELFWYCLDVIRHLKPSYILLENVKGLLTIDEGRTFETIIQSLQESGYHMYWNVLNTKDYGIPQQRERLFMMGFRKRHSFQWPDPLPMPSLVSYVDISDTQSDPIPDYLERSGMLDRIPPRACFIDIGFTNNTHPFSDQICPCITTQGNLWCVPFQRRANVKECLALQGFPPHFKQVVSDRQLKKQIGNSMSVYVVEAILRQALSHLMK